MSLTRDDVIRYLEGLSAAELGNLADELMARLGVPPLVARAAAPVVVLTGEIGTLPELDVVLRNPGADKLAVLALARKLLGPQVGLTEAKALVESAPVVLVQGLSRKAAEEIADALRRAGAEVELR